LIVYVVLLAPYPEIARVHTLVTGLEWNVRTSPSQARKCFRLLGERSSTTAVELPLDTLGEPIRDAGRLVGRLAGLLDRSSDSPQRYE
jgi:hypothetical protein